MTALAPSAVTAPAVATAGVDQDNEARRAVLLAAPAIVILAILFALPLALLLLGSLFGPDGLSVSAYWRLLGDSFYRGVIWNSLRLALMTTGLTLLLGYPAAFGLTLFQGAMRSLLLAALFLPLAASVIVKAFAWTILLRSHGILNEIMLALDIIDKPVRMIFTQGALVFGAANIFLPFMILPIYAVVAQIDRRLGEAASTLGASPVEAFLRVTLPLSCRASWPASPWSSRSPSRPMSFRTS